MVNIHQIA